jgi:hypothetical protein
VFGGKRGCGGWWAVGGMRDCVRGAVGGRSDGVGRVVGWRRDWGWWGQLVGRRTVGGDGQFGGRRDCRGGR